MGQGQEEEITPPLDAPGSSKSQVQNLLRSIRIPPMKSAPFDLPLDGLSVRSANFLQQVGLTDKEEIRAKIQSGQMRPYVSFRHYGLKTHAEVCRWLGLSEEEANPGLTINCAEDLQINAVPPTP